MSLNTAVSTHVLYLYTQKKDTHSKMVYESTKIKNVLNQKGTIAAIKRK